MQMGPAVAPSVDMRTSYVWQRFEVPCEMLRQDPQFGGPGVGQVGQVVVITGMENERERHPHSVSSRQTPVLVEPDPYVPAPARSAVGRVLTVARGFGQHRGLQRGQLAYVDIDDTVKPTYGYAKLGDPGEAARGRARL